MPVSRLWSNHRSLPLPYLVAGASGDTARSDSSLQLEIHLIHCYAFKIYSAHEFKSPIIDNGQSFTKAILHHPAPTGSTVAKHAQLSRSALFACRTRYLDGAATGRQDT